MHGANGDHTVWTLRVRVAHCPPPPVARKLSYPSWKVIVSASRGQYLKPGSYEPGFFSCGMADWRIKLPSFREAQQQNFSNICAIASRLRRGICHAAAPRRPSIRNED